MTNREQSPQNAYLLKNTIPEDLQPIVPSIVGSTWEERFHLLLQHPEGIPGGDEYPTPPVDPLRFRGSELMSRDDALRHLDDYSKGLEIIKDLPLDAYVLVVSTRQGGGNRECYCEPPASEEERSSRVQDADGNYHETHCLWLNNETMEAHPSHLFNEDDDFDSTYATFYYLAPGDYTPEKVEEMAAAAAQQRTWKAQHALWTGIKEGRVPPWATSVNRYESVCWNLLTEEEEQEMRGHERSITFYDGFLQRLQDGTLTEDDLEHVQLQDRYGKHVAALRVALQEETLYREARAEAEALPAENPLRKFFLEERPERPVARTQLFGKGRNRTSSRVWKREAPESHGDALGERLTKNAEYARNDLRYLERDIKERRDKATRRLDYLQRQYITREDAWWMEFPEGEERTAYPVSDNFLA